MQTSKEKITILETNYSNMDKKLDKISNKVDNLVEKIDTLPEKLDQRYASKDYENLAKKLIWLIISTFVLALLGLILKNKL